jgi:hypothetical protein
MKKREKEGTGNRPPTLASLSWYGIPSIGGAVGTALQESGGRLGFETTTAMMAASASSWLAAGSEGIRLVLVGTECSIPLSPGAEALALCTYVMVRRRGGYDT